MVWKVYKVVFRMEAPLHSGWIRVGNIQRTRLFVTARTVWGALTARITRILGNENYNAIGESTNKHLRTSYFYPCFDREGKEIATPVYQSGNLCYDVNKYKLLSEEMERMLVTSYASTAIDSSTLGASYGSLHEIELLNHRTIYGIDKGDFLVNAGNNVYLTGYIFESDKLPSELKEVWYRALKEIQLGGERAYGFGRLHLENSFDNISDVFGCEVLTDRNDPVIKLNSNSPILAHAITDNNLQGVAEPFVCRETDSTTGRFGEKHSVNICWTPGSTLDKDETFKISDFGLWR